MPSRGFLTLCLSLQVLCVTQCTTVEWKSIEELSEQEVWKEMQRLENRELPTTPYPSPAANMAVGEPHDAPVGIFHTFTFVSILDWLWCSQSPDAEDVMKRLRREDEIVTRWDRAMQACLDEDDGEHYAFDSLMYTTSLLERLVGRCALREPLCHTGELAACGMIREELAPTN